MCGISGFLDVVHGVDSRILEKMNNIAWYRGPDDEGYALFQANSSLYLSGSETASPIRMKCSRVDIRNFADSCDFFLGFGHRRLSILDVTEAGHQPMVDESTGCAIVFNGEIYNYLEVRRNLEGLGCTFETSSDTEVLLKAYTKWGEECVKQLNGMWSFAIWDPRTRQLVCSRDRLGAKPFHWWSDGESQFYFGSELKQLCQVPSIPRKINLEYLATSAVYDLSDYNDQTLISGIRILEGGYNLVVSLNDSLTRIESIEIKNYWELSTEHDDGLTEEGCLASIREEFSRSCALRMRSDVPIAVLLSGGLDSSCVAAEVTNLMRETDQGYSLPTYTTSYPKYKECDESQHAQRVNEALGCDGHIITPSPEDLAERFTSAVWHYEGYTTMALVGAMMAAEKVHEDGYKVILNGQCGDETMFGYERYYAYYFLDLIKSGHLFQVVKEFKLAASNSRLTLSSLFLTFLYFNFPSIRSGRKIARAKGFCLPKLLNALDRKKIESLLFPKSLAEVGRTELRHTQLTHIVRFDDRGYMASSVESRIPFMDYQYVEFAMSVPPRLKIQEGWTKYLMRKAYEGKLPKDIIWRKNKMGFPAPAEEWLRKLPDDFVSDLFDNARTDTLFDIASLRAAHKSNPAHPNFQAFLWIELFVRLFDVEC